MLLYKMHVHTYYFFEGHFQIIKIEEMFKEINVVNIVDMSS